MLQNYTPIMEITLFSSLTGRLRSKSDSYLDVKQLVLTFVQVTFSRNGTKMTTQLHISKFEILTFSNKIHDNSDFLSLMQVDTLLRTEKALKYFVFMDFIEENQDFEILKCGFAMSFLFLSQKKIICSDRK